VVNFRLTGLGQSEAAAMDPVEHYQKCALELAAEAERSHDPCERETLRELAMLWRRQADHAADCWRQSHAA
jgi:hypothetical protein